MSHLPALDITNPAWRAFGDTLLSFVRLFEEVGEDAIIDYIKQHRSDELTNFFCNPPNDMEPGQVSDQIGFEFFDMCHDFWTWYWQNYPARAENLNEDIVIEALHKHEYQMGLAERGSEPYAEVSLDHPHFGGCVALAVHGMIFTYLWQELRPFLVS